ncbi:MAG: hypothetical protein KOO69_04490, partial [Victivallales bacterium]|nr:hypothetical protein [Victivallales bacterium]
MFKTGKFMIKLFVLILLLLGPVFISLVQANLPPSGGGGVTDSDSSGGESGGSGGGDGGDGAGGSDGGDGGG